MERSSGFLVSVAHQGGEDLVGFVGLVDFDLQQVAGIGVELGFPELIRVHLAETYVGAEGHMPLGRFDDEAQRRDGGLVDAEAVKHAMEVV